MNDPQPQTGLASPSTRRDRPLVLLVDDEFDVRYVARLLLEDAGYAVVEAANGLHAMERLRTHRPDLMVTDLDMPGATGLDLVHLLRADEATAGIPVLVWSERPAEHIDADHVHPKGLGVHDLVARIDQILGGGT